MVPVRFTQIEASEEGFAFLRSFYEGVYAHVFPNRDERERLENMWRSLREGTARGGGNTYHIIVATLAGEIVGGAVIDYLAAPRVGVVEFIFTVEDRRGCGIGSALLREIVRVLEADAQHVGAGPPLAIVAEVHDPYVAAESDSMDGFARASVWAHWGFGILRFPYVQPPLSAEQAPVAGLLLLAKMFDEGAGGRVSADWVESLLWHYLEFAMRIPEPTANPEFLQMCRWLEGVGTVDIVSLHAYIGEDPNLAFVQEEVRGTGPLFEQVVAFVRSALPGPGRVASRDEFAAALRGSAGLATSYHLWALREHEAAPVEGAASFFTLGAFGYAGYIVLDGRLRGRGLLAQLVARIERRMILDDPACKGWFVECVPESVVKFLRAGFSRVLVDYRPPPVGDARAWADAERFELLYKGHGGSRCTCAPEAALRAIAAILSKVYGVAEVRDHPCFVRAARSLALEEFG